MKLINVLSLISVCYSQIIFTEVMFDLDGSDSPNEFIELFNNSTEVVDLTNWLIADKLSTDELTSDNYSFAPNQFALILEGDYDGFYDHFIPNETLILSVDDLSIGNGLGNSQDSLFLISNSGDTISIMGWNEGILSGFSLEKIAFELSNSFLNWQQSIDSLGTPGFTNSVEFMTIDVGLDSVYSEPRFPKPYEDFSLFVHLTNNGLYSSQTSTFVNGILENSNFLDSQDNHIVEINNISLSSGNHEFIILQSTEDDFNNLNDSITFIIDVQYLYGDVLINEIMYDPLSNQPEWVEIVNISQDEINLLDWSINDAEEFTNPPIEIEFTLPSNSTVVISEDSINNFIFMDDFPGLNNSGDDIFLIDPTGQMIDHVQYNPDWGGGDGYSLERITHYLDSNNESNWGTSVSTMGSTPNDQNSLYIESIQETGVITISPNPFSPDGDGHEDNLYISYHLPFTQSILMADIYNSSGRKMVSISNGEHVAMEGILFWNGKDSRGIKCRIGQYLMVIEASSVYSNESWKSIERIIVAK